ncbi:MAG: T9SS type A sorting domain-containing protein [Ignavibacteria bacterium]|nr:T9SS type A sorting domain-containing protein [Ignavibacteria bacterium]
MKFFLSAILLLSIVSVLTGSTPSYSNSVFTPEEIKQLSSIPVKIYFNGEHYYSDKFRLNLTDEKHRMEIYKSEEKDNTDFLSIVSLTLDRNYYDLQTNNSPQLIWQNPNNVNDVHAVYTFSSEPVGWSDRRIQYFYSSDKGISWNIVTDIPPTVNSGFPVISGLSSGVPVIAAHYRPGSIIKTAIFIDAFPGLGSFASYEPGGGYIWPKIAGGENVNLTNKYFLLSSSSDSLKYNKASSSLGNFSGYNHVGKSSGGAYTIAAGIQGVIGIAYVNKDASPDNFGDVMFMQSTNNGETFSSAQKIFDANFSTDSLAGFMGISMIYRNGNQPYVAFETVKQNMIGNYYPGAPSKIRVWSSALNGGQSIIIADSNNIQYAPARGTTDLEAPICRPALGVSSTGSVIYCTMMVQNANTGGADTTSYNDIYISYMGGTTFSAPRRMNPAAPRNDWTYPSPSNYIDLPPLSNIINLVVQRDTIPGSNVNTPNAATDAGLFYITANAVSTTILTAPSLYNPVNGQQNERLDPTFSWNSSGPYSDLQLSTSNTFSTILHSVRVSEDFYQLPLGILSDQVTYFWRVRKFVNNEYSNWSLTYSFRTGIAAVNNITTVIPDKFFLYNNFPNPFNPLTKIKFDLPKSSLVKLSVFDLNGRRVNELVNEMLQPGRYETEFNGVNLSSGVYYYRIEANEFTSVNKMILIK